MRLVLNCLTLAPSSVAIKTVTTSLYASHKIVFTNTAAKEIQGIYVIGVTLEGSLYQEIVINTLKN